MMRKHIACKEVVPALAEPKQHLLDCAGLCFGKPQLYQGVCHVCQRLIHWRQRQSKLLLDLQQRRAAAALADCEQVSVLANSYHDAVTC